MKNYLSILFIIINKEGFIKNDKIIAKCMKPTKPMLVPTQTDNSKIFISKYYRYVIIKNNELKILKNEK